MLMSKNVSISSQLKVILSRRVWRRLRTPRRTIDQLSMASMALNCGKSIGGRCVERL